MALKEDNVRVITSLGAECFVCDRPIKEGTKSIEVTFRLFIPVRKELHPKGCAEGLVDLLKKRAFEAQR